MANRKIFIILLAVCLVALTSTMALFYYWEDVPKKAPMRAKQVLLFICPALNPKE
ncbi:Hypothetical protein LUCI_3251 [Lucifera butyrica]|uniref:Uncharacterized protein n=1 Tax=Lucifera butyrica TaxID=1351585 RepID=A0A498R5I9_9FIRM|nr:Hypothetical protein LUCI_3251 [Lucifera butyrica]